METVRSLHGYARLLLAGVLILSTSACAPQAVADANRTQWSGDVIGIELMHLSADFWINRIPEPDRLIMDAAAIHQFNSDAFKTDPHLTDLSSFPETMEGTAIADLIQSISKPASSTLYFMDGREFTGADYAALSRNLNLDAIAQQSKVEFGLVTRRTDMRTWPTKDRVYKSEATKDLDRFQENGLFPSDQVAVLHTSRDGDWLFVQSYNYAAWVARDSIATGDRGVIDKYKASRDVLVITGDKVTTNFNPEIPEISELQLDMGVALPLVSYEDAGNNVNGQNPYTSYVVRLPVRKTNGELEFRLALIARRHDVHEGWLPYTAGNIIRQGFKFLGERYGWGHSYNARDCTGLVSEIYKTFGILLPRNSGQQGASSLGRNHRFTEDQTAADRRPVLDAMQIGDLIYSPGHVMMYVGRDNEEPYILHDSSSGLRYRDANGQTYKGVLNGVAVTPLVPLQVSEQHSYVDVIYNIKQIR